MKKIPTGIEGLDRILEGGFPIGYNFVIEGDIGTSKSILVHHLAYEHLKMGGTVLYLITNRKPENIIEETSQFGWDLKKYIKKKKVAWVNCFSSKAGVTGVTPINNLTNISIVIDETRKVLQKQGNVMEIFDSVSDLFINNELTACIHFLQSACARAMESNTVAFFMLDRGAQPAQALISLESITQGTIKLKTEDEKEYIKIQKILGLKHPLKWFEFEIGDKGIEIKK